MSTTPILVTVRGNLNSPSTTEYNIRSGPGTTYDKPFRTRAGTKAESLLEVRPDENRANLKGKIYQWFRLAFPDGQTGWMRDDLLEIQGDCSAFGYGVVKQPALASSLVRDESTIPKAPPVVTPPPVEPAPVTDEQERIRRASFNITAAFEGGGYATYQNYDSGIVSYGRFQFTLVSSLGTVIDRYLTGSASDTANELRSAYLQRVRDRDPKLRNDERFKLLLRAAAEEPAMQLAQDSVATERYWNVVQDLSIKPRNIRTALGQALIFDMGINFGTRHGFLSKAEEELKVPAKSRAGENGTTEQKLITKLAELRKESHYRQADRDNLPGLKVRGDFWVNLCQRGDWNLQGDANGLVVVKSGRSVQVRNP